MPHYKVIMVILSMSGYCFSAVLIAAQEPVSVDVNELPNSDFLEFLGGMAEIDGEMTDPLDMLDMQEDSTLLNDNLKKNHESEVKKEPPKETQSGKEYGAEIKNKSETTTNDKHGDMSQSDASDSDGQLTPDKLHTMRQSISQNATKIEENKR